MRTTITLESDVEALLKKFMRERGLGFKEAVNVALRSALAAPRSTVDFSFPSFDMGVSLVPMEHALQLAAELEDEEIARELSAGR